MSISWMRQRGITLIEMMLVVTVIAVATLSTIKILRSRLSTTAIDQLVIQMQNVAQGTINYYMLNNAWPTTATTPSSLLSLTNGTGTNPINTIFFPSATLCTPLVDRRQRSGLCNGYSLIEGQALNSATYYQLVLETHNSDVATALANQLPDAEVVNNTQVVMSLLAPAQNFLRNPNQGWIVAAGVTRANSLSPSTDIIQSYASNTLVSTPIMLPNCPARFEGHIIFMPYRFQTISSGSSGGQSAGYYGFHITQATVYGNQTSFRVGFEPPLSYSPPNGDCCSLPTKNLPTFYNGLPGSSGGSSVYNTTDARQPVYAVRLADMPDSNESTNNSPNTPPPSYGADVYYLTFCIPVGHWFAADIPNNYTQDGQCRPSKTTSWTEFLETGNPQTTVGSAQNCLSYAGGGSASAVPRTILGSPNAY